MKLPVLNKTAGKSKLSFIETMAATMSGGNHTYEGEEGDANDDALDLATDSAGGAPPAADATKVGPTTAEESTTKFMAARNSAPPTTG